MGHFNSDIGITTGSAQIARKQLNALEEARAVRAMLQRGLSEDGAAQALGWAKARVTARVKILELPEAAQQLVGEGVIALGAIDNLLAVGRVSPELLDALVACVDENRWAADRLSREPGWVLGQAMREQKVKAFGAYLNHAGSHEVEALRLGKKAAEQLAEAERLYRQVDRYVYGPPAIRFDDADVDRARAAGVLIEFEHGTPVICDRALFRELAKGAIARTVVDLRERAAAAATAQKAVRKAKGPVDPLAEARRERDGPLRAAADSAHAANLDLGVALINGLTVVDPADINVARFFVLCRRRHRTNYADLLTMPTRCLSPSPVPADVAVIVAVLLIASRRLGDVVGDPRNVGCGGLTDGSAGLLGDAEVVDIAEAAHLSGGVRDP